MKSSPYACLNVKRNFKKFIRKMLCRNARYFSSKRFDKFATKYPNTIKLRKIIKKLFKKFSLNFNIKDKQLEKNFPLVDFVGRSSKTNLCSLIFNGIKIKKTIILTLFWLVRELLLIVVVWI